MCLLAAFSGCNSRTGRVHVWGEVTYDGRPVDEGAILLAPIGETGGAATGGPISKGRYDIPAKIGPLANTTYRVEITGLQRTGQTIETPQGTMQLREQYIPSGYNSRSTITVTITASDKGGEHDFTLARMSD